MNKTILTLKGGHSYPIIIDIGLSNSSLSLLRLNCRGNVVLITNDRLAHLHLSSIKNQLNRSGVKIDQIIIPDGEQNKSLKILDQIFTALLSKYYGRDATIIAFGGGVIGDIAGFVASSYYRGVNFIQIPTTLLAQVDSSIGGKNAINHPLGKNMIGSFYHPSLVIINLDYLLTLPQRELSSGLAEAIKYGIAFDAEFFYWLENHLSDLLNLNVKALYYCIRRCCELKMRVVSSDELEYGQRLILNFGHTYGHAIEAYMGYGNWLHGEAVSAGMMMAIRAALRLGQFNNVDAYRVSTLLQRARLPINGPKEMVAEDYIPYIIRDKKSVAGKPRLILPTMIGNAKVYANIDIDLLMSSVKDC